MASDGTLYVSTDGVLTALNTNGSLKWIFDADRKLDTVPVLGNDGRVYFGAGKFLYAVNPDGTQQWRYDAGKEIDVAPAVASDGSVYLAAGKTISKLSSSGTMTWTSQLAEKAAGFLKLDAEGNVLVGMKGAIEKKGAFAESLWFGRICDLIGASTSCEKDAECKLDANQLQCTVGGFAALITALLCKSETYAACSEGEQCGIDACGYRCGDDGKCADPARSCDAEKRCIDRTANPCRNKQCGDDGQGGTCGSCTKAGICDEGVCAPSPTASRKSACPAATRSSSPWKWTFQPKPRPYCEPSLKNIWRRDAGVVAKPGAAMQAVYTWRIPDNYAESDFVAVQNCPTMLQREVGKVSDVRVTMVDGHYSASRITANGRPLLDWRALVETGLTYEPVRLATDVVEKTHQLMERLSISFGAFDFAEESDGTFQFLEVNPSGQWEWLDVEAGASIAESIATALMERAE